MWQRRSDTVDHPGGWTISVAGTAVPGVALERQIAAEADEELGLTRGDLLGLEPLALVDDRRGRTVQVVFRAGLSPSARIVPRPERGGRDPAGRRLPATGAVETLTAAWWPDLVRLATEEGSNSPQMDDFYRENILDHYKNPRNSGHLEHPTATAEGVNPLCGDELAVELDVDGGVVRDVRFNGRGCAISQAAASMISDVVKGKTVAEVRALGLARTCSRSSAYRSRPSGSSAPCFR